MGQLLSQSTIEVMPRLCQWMALAEEVVSGHSSDTTKMSQKTCKRWPESEKTYQTHLLAVRFGRHRGYPDVFEGSLLAVASAPTILVAKECRHHFPGEICCEWQMTGIFHQSGSKESLRCFFLLNLVPWNLISPLSISAELIQLMATPKFQEEGKDVPLWQHPSRNSLQCQNEFLGAEERSMCFSSYQWWFVLFAHAHPTQQRNNKASSRAAAWPPSPWYVELTNLDCWRHRAPNHLHLTTFWRSYFDVLETVEVSWICLEKVKSNVALHHWHKQLRFTLVTSSDEATRVNLNCLSQCESEILGVRETPLAHEASPHNNGFPSVVPRDIHQPLCLVGQSMPASQCFTTVVTRNYE